MGKIKRLTIQEFNVINRLSNLANCDWFYIASDDDGEDFIRDLDERRTYSLKEGILLLDDCLTDLDDYGLTAIEKETYINLIKKIKG